MIDWSTVHHFVESEFRCHCGSCPGSTHPPIDKALIIALDMMRERFGHPVTVTSGYRCAAHNAAVGGASDSAHITGQAVDIRWQGVRRRLLLRASLDAVSRLEIAEHLHLEHRPERRPDVWVGKSR